MLYNYCLGIELDSNYVEQVCKKRDNCMYYLEDIFVRFKPEQLESDFLLNEPGQECRYFLQRHVEEKRQECEDPFAPIAKKL